MRIQSKAARRVLVGIALVVAAYAAQFGVMLVTGSGKGGPGNLGYALLTVSEQVLERHRIAEPMRMTIFGAYGASTQCRFWTFEETWGRCATVVLGVLEDERGFDEPEIMRRAHRLLEEVAHPCGKLSEGTPYKAEKELAMGCGSSWRPFRVAVRVRLVKPRPNGIHDASDPKLWNVVTVKFLNEIHMKGKT